MVFIFSITRFALPHLNFRLFLSWMVDPFSFFTRFFSFFLESFVTKIIKRQYLLLFFYADEFLLFSLWSCIHFDGWHLSYFATTSPIRRVRACVGHFTISTMTMACATAQSTVKILYKRHSNTCINSWSTGESLNKIPRYLFKKKK